MSSLVAAVFKATMGLLVDKRREAAAERLKEGDVTDQKFRGLIVQEMDDIKSKLDGLSRKDLRAVCCKNRLRVCKIEKSDFLKICQNKGFGELVLKI